MPTVESLLAELATLRAELSAAKAELAAARSEIAELRARLSQGSANSSLPPSADIRKGRRRTVPSGLAPGGQPGHPGKTRTPFPPEAVDRFLDHDPERCAICGADLLGAPRLDAATFQVVELEGHATRVVTEHRLWRKRCPSCGKRTRAPRPEGVPAGVYGPRLKAVLALLSGVHRMSRRSLREALQEIFGIPMGLATIQACCLDASGAMAPAHEAVRQEVQAAPAVHADETGFGRCGADRMWLWAAITPGAELFLLRPGRGKAAAMDLLGEGFAGILHRDRWRPYEALVAATHQLCWAHVRRDLQAMLEAGGETGVQGAMLLLASDRAFAWWHRLLDGEVSREGLARAMTGIRREVRERLARIRDGDGPRKARGTARDLLRQEAALWTYVDRDGAVPTNNEAERGIRKAVLWRKGSFGANAEAGCRFVERILTVAGTARRRGVNFLAWLTEAIRSAAAGVPTPSIAPA